MKKISIVLCLLSLVKIQSLLCADKKTQNIKIPPIFAGNPFTTKIKKSLCTIFGEIPGGIRFDYVFDHSRNWSCKFFLGKQKYLYYSLDKLTTKEKSRKMRAYLRSKQLGLVSNIFCVGFGASSCCENNCCVIACLSKYATGE